MEMAGTGSRKTHALFLVGNYGDCRPSLSGVGIQTPFCTHDHSCTTLKSSEGTRRRGDHRAGRASRATLTPFPTLISPFYSSTSSIKIGCRISCPPLAPSPHLSPPYLPAFSLPLLLHLFFFELLSAQSRTYNLTPPSSLHPVITPVS